MSFRHGWRRVRDPKGEVAGVAGVGSDAGACIGVLGHLFYFVFCCRVGFSWLARRQAQQQRGANTRMS
jgi:hypothetical protein